MVSFRSGSGLTLAGKMVVGVAVAIASAGAAAAAPAVVGLSVEEPAPEETASPEEVAPEETAPPEQDVADVEGEAPAEDDGVPEEPVDGTDAEPEDAAEPDAEDEGATEDDATEDDADGTTGGPGKDLPDAASFGQSVAADARDGGVDGAEISARAHARNDERRADRDERRADRAEQRPAGAPGNGVGKANGHNK